MLQKLSSYRVSDITKTFFFSSKTWSHIQKLQSSSLTCQLGVALSSQVLQPLSCPSCISKM